MSARINYWLECVSGAAEECGASLAPEPAKFIAGAVEGAHENYSMAFGDDVATANWYAAQRKEVSDLKESLRREKAKVICRRCMGSGQIVTYGGTLMSTMQCWKCRGDGRHDP